MKVFVDANILVSVLNKEYPLFHYTSRILSLNLRKDFEVISSPICLAIAWYFAEKKWSSKEALEKIKILSRNLEIVPARKEDVFLTINNKKIQDFEDGLEYYAAVYSICDCIITENNSDFYFSEIPVYKAREFFDQQLLKLN